MQSQFTMMQVFKLAPSLHDLKPKQLKKVCAFLEDLAEVTPPAAICKWVYKPNQGLDKKRPIDLLRTGNFGPLNRMLIELQNGGYN